MLSFRPMRKLAFTSRPLMRHISVVQLNKAAPSSPSPPPANEVFISDRCVQRLTALSKKHGKPVPLRLQVDSGGCSGFKYEFVLDSDKTEEDRVFERDGVKLLVDDSSFNFVKGATVDFSDSMIKSGFEVINNKNAEAGCGCGHSFSIPVS